MKRVAVLLCVAVAACAPLSEAEIAEINKDADVSGYTADGVTITSWSEETNPEIVAEAERACGLTGRRAQILGVHEADTADGVSYMGYAAYKNEHEFACLPG